jgi:hypothetical protein
VCRTPAEQAELPNVFVLGIPKGARVISEERLAKKFKQWLKMLTHRFMKLSESQAGLISFIRTS